MSLAAKQEVLDEAFRQALEEMCSLPEEQYIQLLARLAVQASSTGREQLIFSPKDRTRIGKAVVMAANDALVKQVAPELPDAITDSKVGAFLGKVVNSAAAQITGHRAFDPVRGDEAHPGRLHHGGRPGGGQLRL